MMLLHGGHNMNTVIWLILVFLKDSVYLASADTDEYQPIRVLAERNIVHKYEGSRKEMVVTMGDANYGEEKQDRRDVTHIRIHNKAMEVGISMVNNLELFLWRQDPRIFEKPEILSSLIQGCDVAEEDRGWEDEESDTFCTLKDSAIKFLEETPKCNMEYDKQSSNQSINDDHDVESVRREAKCGIYLAPSTIPNSGNGMFTGINLPLETDLENIPFFMLSDMNFDIGSNKDYSWDTRNENGISYVRTLTTSHKNLIGGLGSLTNYHPGLVNVKRRDDGPWFKPLLDSTKDPGAGAITDFENAVTYAAKSIVAGSEFFISYGDNWLKARSEYESLPTSESYRLVDKMISYLFGILSIKGKFEYFKMFLVLLSSLPNIDKRIKSIFQTIESVEDIVNIIIGGGAASLEKRASYSLEWLEQNGRCLDHIYSHLSDMPSAGRGAFSRRFIKKGEVVITSPLMAFQKSHLEEFYDKNNKIVPPHEFESRQVLLNYCYSHPKSSVALFPLTHAILINHASVRNGSNRHPNAKIRWANDHTETQHLLHSSLELVKERKAARPFLEFIAIRDIEPDEEVLIDYGEAWENAWNDHLTDWSLKQSVENIEISSLSILAMNENIFNVSHSWSEVHMTVCSKVKLYDEALAGNATEYHGFDKDDKLIDLGHIADFIPCKIVGTNRERETFDVVYYWNKDDPVQKFVTELALEEIHLSEYYILKDLPAFFLMFTEKPGRSDERRAGSFRHEIMIPDDIFPESWKDISNVV